MATIGPKGSRYRLPLPTGTMLQRPFKGKMVATGWPRHRRRRKTESEFLSVLAFDLSITFLRYIDSWQWKIAREITRGTQWRVADLLQALQYGTIYGLQLATGENRMPIQAVIKVSNSLDVLGNIDGMLLYRTGEYWTALKPPDVKSTLVYDPATGHPTWEPV